MRRGLFCSALAAACLVLMAAAQAQPERVELLRDPQFLRGFAVNAPAPGKIDIIGALAGPEAGEPIWALRQWSSRFDIIAQGRREDVGEGVRYTAPGKSIAINAEDADLILAVDTLAEYGETPNDKKRGWAHLLAGQKLDPLSPPLNELARLDFEVDLKLLRSEPFYPERQNERVHAAQFLLYFTLQNRNRQSEGHGDFLWLGVPAYDNRKPFFPKTVIEGDGGPGGLGKLIYHPPYTVYAEKSLHEGEWVTLQTDLLPIAYDALETAWQRGFLPGSQDPADYRISAMSIGWEVPGTFDVAVAARNLSLEATLKEDDARVQPAKAEVRAVEGEGAPALFVNGEREYPFAYLIHQGDKPRHYQQMADAGVRFFTTGAGLGNTPEGFDPEGLLAPFEQILAAQPDAFIFPRIGVTPPQWWLDQHPEERVVFDDGTMGPQSMFSEAWLRDAVRWIEDYSRFLRSSALAGHIIGIHICSGTTAEWQSWGLWDNKRGDFSAPAERAWRAYLQEKYGNEAALSAYWGRELTWEEAQMPSRARREGESPLLRDPAQWQDVIDFYDFYWRGTAHAIQELAAAAKRGGGRDWLVGFFYGYELMYGGKMQESQHLGMREVMDCPDIDFFTSPAMYIDRGPGGASNFMSFTDSIQHRGKLWWDEADNRTHFAIDGPFGAVFPATNLFESLNVLEREWAHTLAQEAAIWWFDMGGGWYDDPAIMRRMAEMRELGEKHTPAWRPEAQIGVFIDDKSAYRMPPESPWLNHLAQFIAALPRLGAPYDTWLLSDLPQAPDYDCYVFPLANDLTDEERTAIQALRADGRRIFFLGYPGAGTYEDGFMAPREEGAEGFVGVPPVEEVRGSVTMSLGSVDRWKLTPENALTHLEHLLTDHAGEYRPIHRYATTGDAVSIGNGLISIHAKSAGEKTLYLPEALRLREVLADTPLTLEGERVSFDMKQAETRTFLVSPLKE